jgi:hypothetical protein
MNSRLVNGLSWLMSAFSLLCVFVMAPKSPLHVGLLLVVSTLLFSPPIRRRISRFFPGTIATVALVAGMSLAAKYSDQEAKQLGFNDGSSYREAQQKGLSTQSALDAEHLKEAQKAADDAALEKQKAIADAAAADRASDAEEAKTKSDNETCSMDLHCWGEKHAIEATFACKPLVERLAKYQFEWTDGWLDTKFTKYGWNDQNTGVVTYVGDKIKFQNGFGAWQYMTYRCDYNPNTKTVANVDAAPGRLPD